jgi:uncharacterized membrane protein YdjX (TVP38/TMEM64 family)
MAGAVFVLGAMGFFLSRRSELEAVHEYAARLNGGVAFALLVVLPLLGFPASVLHVAAGVRFGAPLGLALVSLSIVIQLFASYGFVRLWRHHFSARLAHWRSRVPRGAHGSICVVTVLLPGAPFSVVNYILPLIGVPLRTYVLCCWPLHTLRATVTVLLGGETGHFTTTRVLVLMGYALLLLVASGWTYRRLRRQLAAPRAAANGQRQPA